MASDNSFYIGIPTFGAQAPINYDSSCPKYIQITGISQSVEDVGTYYNYTMQLVDPSSLTSNTYIIHYCNASSEEYNRSWMTYSRDIFAHNGSKQYYNSIDSLPVGTKYWTARTDVPFGNCNNSWPNFGHPGDWGQDNVQVYLFNEASTVPPKTTITLNKAGGSGGTDTVYGAYDHILPHISIPTRNGFEFSGYSNERSGSEPGELYYNSDGDSTQKWTQIGGTATLYAKWTNTITFNPHDGECWAVDAETPGIATTGPRTIHISSPAGCPGGRPTFTTNISGWTVSSTGQTLTIPSGTSVGTRIVTITAESPSSSSDDGYIGETITRTISITIKSPNVTTYSGIYITDRKCDLTPSSSNTYDDSPEANGYGEYYYDTASGKIIRPATGYVESPWFTSGKDIPASQITIDDSIIDDYVGIDIYAYQKIINPDFTEDWVEIPLTWGGSHTFASLGTTETEIKITQFNRKITFTFSGQGGSRNVLTFNLDDYISSPDNPDGTDDHLTYPIYREANKPGPASWYDPDITHYSYSPDPISAGGGTSRPTVTARQGGTRTWSSGSSEILTGSLSYSYSISGTGFSINSSTGVVTASDRTNIDGSERSATVTVTVTGGGDKTATKTTSVRQEANTHSDSWYDPDITQYSYSPDPISAGGGTSRPTVTARQGGTRTWSSGSSEILTGSLSYSYSISGTGFSINSSTGVVTASDRTNIDGSERSATVTVTVTGGGDKTATKTTSVRQEANTHSDSWSKPVVTSVTYSYPDISACGGTSTPSVGGTITQNGERRWTSGTIQSLSNSGLSNFTKSYYMTTGSGFSIDTSTGVITQANSRGRSELGITSNTATLTLSANGESDEVTATCTQSGNTYTDSWPDISMTCSYPDIDACGGISTPTVNATQGKGKRIWGCNAGTEDLPAPTLSYEYYLTIPNDFTMDSDTGVVTAPGAQGQTTDSRSCTVWVYVTGGGGVTAQDTVTCTQSGNTYTDSWPAISMNCSYPEIDACGGTSTPIVSVTYSECKRIWGCDAGEEPWDSEPTLHYRYFLDTPNGFTVKKNTGVVTAPGKQGKTTHPRSCTVSVSVSGEMYTTKDVTCTQSGNTYIDNWDKPSISAYSYPNIAASGGTSTPTVTATQSGTRTWDCDAGTEPLSNDRFTYSYSMTTGNGFSINTSTGKITAENRGTTPGVARTATAKVTVTGSDYRTAEKTAACTQGANVLEGITFTVGSKTISYQGTTKGTVTARYTSGSTKDVENDDATSYTDESNPNIVTFNKTS